MGRSLVISATRITCVLDYFGAAISFDKYSIHLDTLSIFKEYTNIIPYLDKYDSYTCIVIYYFRSFHNSCYKVKIW